MKTYKNDRYIYTPASRWIKINYKIITERHSLFEYAEIDDIYPDKRMVTYFKHNGKMYSINQFMRLSYPIMLEDTDGKTIVICGYDSTIWYKPYLIEIHPDGEYIRLWNETENNENI